jgi:hypothetical protein
MCILLTCLCGMDRATLPLPIVRSFRMPLVLILHLYASDLSDSHILKVISCFRRDVDENCTLLGYYTTLNGNPLPNIESVRSPSFQIACCFFVTLSHSVPGAHVNPLKTKRICFI